VVAAASAEDPLAAVVVACAAMLLALRARRHRDRVEAITSVVGGVAPWLVLGVAALSEPACRPVAAVVATAVGAAAFLARPTARVVRMMDVTESVLVLVLPTLVVGWVARASGLWPVVLG
jgi:hypothetical protein